MVGVGRDGVRVVSRAEMREGVARAIRESLRADGSCVCGDVCSDASCACCLEAADAALVFIRAAMREPSAPMLNEAADLSQDDEDNDPLGCDEVRSEYRSIWRAMLAASPLAEPDA